ncbi:MAG: hypothetical protein VR68_10870 [Peptococcaceae bacterium BRH_c4a]|nr:MAG: hypothetical protein VR68_10870 [Peptococcaceae bacterium BRH_c4a]
MLSRVYAIPILFGICLGAIMAGVQVSANALGSAIGDHGAVSLIVIESMDGGRATIRALGKKLSINASLQDEAGVFERAVPEKLTAVYRTARGKGVHYLEKVSLIGGLALEDIVKRCREEICEIRQGLAK